MFNNDLLFSYLGSLGYTGTVDDRLYSYLIAATGYTGTRLSIQDLLRLYFQKYGIVSGAGSSIQDLILNSGFMTTDLVVRRLFQEGAKGIWLDPADFSTMFQDSAGTTPVTAVGQTVQLMLDKSAGRALGSELLGSFTTAKLGTATDATYNTSTGEGQIFRVDGSNTSYIRRTGLTANKMYQVRITNTSATSISVRQNGLAGTISSVGPGLTLSVYVSTSTYTDISIASDVNGTSPTFTINSVREISGNHVRLFNATIQARVNMLLNTASTLASGSTSWGGSNITGTVQGDGSSLIARTSTAASANSQQVLATSLFHVGSVCTLQIKVKKATIGNLYGIRIQGTYPDRADAVVNLDTGAISYSGNSGAFTGVSASIIGTGADGFIHVKLSTNVVTTPVASIVHGPANAASNVWEATSATLLNAYAKEPQLEYGSTPTTYQRVNTATDYQDIGAPRRINFNGTSAYGVTLSTITPGADKVFVCAGVRKASDAARGIVCETSVGGANGSFQINAPSSNGLGNYAFGSGGTIINYAASGSTSYISPITNIISGIGDISGDSAILRVNGAQAASSSSDQGTGNYTAQLLYIGARAGTSLWFNGDLFGLVIVFKQANASEIQNTERFQASRTGIAW